MPTYDYICKDCGHTFEEFQSMSDPVLTSCPACSGNLQRIITGGTGLIFKGSGFYITDYSKKKNEPSKSQEKGTIVKEKNTAKPAVQSEKTSAKPSAGTSKNHSK